MALSTSNQNSIRDLHRSIDNHFRRFFDDMSLDLPLRIDDFGFGSPILPPTALSATRSAAAWNPSIDVCDTANCLKFHCELPGMNPDDIAVDLKDNALCISGKKAKHIMDEGDNYVVEERSTGSFCRTFRLPPTTTKEDISANYKDGILEVSVNKPASIKNSQPERISIA